MNHAFRTALCLFYVSAYLLIPPLSYSQDNPTQADLDALGRTIANVQQGIESTRARRNSLETEIETSERAISDIRMQIDRLQADIRNTQTRLTELAQQQQELQLARQSQQELVGQYLLAAYQNGREEYLKLLLNQESIAGSARTMRYYQYFNTARAGKIAEFEGILREIAEVSRELLENETLLETQRNDLQNEQDQLLQQQDTRQTLLARLESELASSNSELSRLEVQYEEMALLIEELSRAITDLSLGIQGESFASRRGALPWPLEGRLLNRFGERYQLGDLNWEGVNISGESGADVRAIHHGRVVYADWFSSSGLLLIIDHGDGYMSLYAHNQSLFKEVGEWVLAGEVIAAVGNTGGRDAYGVYFEIRYNGEAQDPVNWLLRR